MVERKHTLVDMGFFKFKFKLTPVETIECSEAVDEWLTKCEQLVKEELERQFKGD